MVESTPLKERGRGLGKSAEYGGTSNVDLAAKFRPRTASAGAQLMAFTKETREGSHWFWGSLIFMNTIVGFGILTLPAVVQMAGLSRGLFLEVIVIVLMFTSLLVIGFLATEHTDLPTYESIFGHYFNHWVERMVACIILINMYVPCIAYCVAIRDQISTLIHSNIPHEVGLADPWYLNTNFLMFAVCIVVIFPLTLLQKIEHLRQASATASICILYLAGTIIATYFFPNDMLNKQLFVMAEKDPYDFKPSSWACSFTCIGSFVTAYFIQFVGPPVYERTKPKTFASYIKMSSLSIGVCIFVYNSIIIFAILASPSRLFSDILLNLNPQHPATIIAYLLYILKLCFEYPILAFVGREGILSILPDVASTTKPHLVKIFIAVLWFGSTILLAMAVPEILTATQIVGFFASPLCLLFPGACLLRYLSVYPIQERAKRLFIQITSWTLQVSGVIICILILYQTILNYLPSSENPCTTRRINH